MKHSIHTQIEEVERGLVEFRRNAAGEVRRGRATQAQMDFRAQRIEAALATLRWVRDHAEELRRQAAEAG